MVPSRASRDVRQVSTGWSSRRRRARGRLRSTRPPRPEESVSMVDQDRTDAAFDDALAAAEEVAAREAEAEAAADAADAAGESPKVVRPRTRTSGRAASQKRAPASTAGGSPAKDRSGSGSLIKASSPSARPVSGDIE